MGKWLTNTLAALVLLALTSLLGALLKGPIDGLSNQNRLNAEVQFAPWIPKPDFSDESEKKTQISAPSDINPSDILQKLEFKQSALHDYGIAVMNISNSSNKTVSAINVRVHNIIDDPQVAMIDSDGTVRVIEKTRRVKVADMNPGDKATLFFWGSFYSYQSDKYFQTFSSEGAFRTNYNLPSPQDEEYLSSFGKFLDDYAWSAFVVFVVIIVVVLVAALVMYTEYMKGIFVSSNLYSEEAKRFLEDPKKFQMNTDSAQAAWNVHQGRMNDESSEPSSDARQENVETGNDSS